MTAVLQVWGGAGFPTHKKYKTDKTITDLLINGAECEPFLTCDYRLMLENGYALLNGVRILLKASGASKAYVCLEDNKPLAAENLNKILAEMTASGLMGQEENIRDQGSSYKISTRRRTSADPGSSWA